MKKLLLLPVIVLAILALPNCGSKCCKKDCNVKKDCVETKHKPSHAKELSHDEFDGYEDAGYVSDSRTR